MAHYAFINDDNVVVEVIVGRDENEKVNGITDWEEYYASQRENLRCFRTSYNTYLNKHINGGTPFRGNYAGKGYTFEENLGEHGVFLPPKPSEDCVLDEETYSWLCPEEDDS